MNAWWLVLPAVIGASLGVLVMGALCAGSHEDEGMRIIAASRPSKGNTDDRRL